MAFGSILSKVLQLQGASAGSGFTPRDINSTLAQTMQSRQNFTIFTPRTADQQLSVIGPNELPVNQRRFQPTERAVLGQINQTGLADRVNEAIAGAGRRAGVNEGIFERQTRGRGVSDRQRTAANRSLSLQRRLAEAGAGSAERRRSAEGARNAVTAAGQLEDQLLSQEIAGLTNIANSTVQKRLSDERREAQEDANKDSLIGSLAGLAFGSAFAFSSEEWKDKRGPTGKLLDKLDKVRVERWNYKGDDEEHIGAYAEEFNETFGVGKRNPKMISLVDAVGVLMGSMKELNEKVEARVA